ncbi:MAG: hypothetical protein MI867_00820, partial [Pseudomonadales bacterium]|nr:hypothetical protein [Pseudomonadales bacterium]
GCETPMQWIDIGTVSDLWNANQSALNQDILHFPMKGTEVAPGVFAGTNVNANWDTISVKGPVYIGSGTTIEDGVTIEGPVLISENTHVESETTLRKCVIDPYTQIERGTEINQEWINPEFSIDLSEKSCVSTETDSTRASDIREARTMSNVSVLPQRAKG